MLRDIRYSYTSGTLEESQAEPNPFKQFEVWMKVALEANLHEPNGMILSTVGPENRPSSRAVLLRGFDSSDFVFFTNYNSRKGQEIAGNPFACISFWWPTLERQVRIEGRIAKVESAESDEYFTSRPYGSRIGSAASPQSQIIESRSKLEQIVAELEAQYPEEVPRPEHWGGYRLSPDYLEFWQGRPSRLHDRLTYRLQADGSWLMARLAP
jgi:pyridoxamine 5'-phosphate oxidase